MRRKAGERGRDSGSDRSLTRVGLGGGIEDGMVWRGVCVLGRGWCDRSKSSRSGGDFPIKALKMCWRIFQRVLG